MNGETTICLCEDTVDGIFTAIYKAWEMGTSRTSVQVEKEDTLSLFATYVKIETDTVLALKVADSIRKKISEEAYSYVYQAALSDYDDKAQYIYRFLIKGFKTGKHIVDYLHDDDVCKVFEMSRFVGREAHRYLMFVRFEELSNGVLISRINPRSNVIPLITEHFSDRLHNENWIILDTVRNFAAVHRSGMKPVLAGGVLEEDLLSIADISDKELEFQQLWKCFFDTIAIKERVNEKQQMLMMPKRYRKYMKAENS